MNIEKIFSRTGVKLPALWSKLILEVKIMTRCIQPSYIKDFQCDGQICGCRCCRDWRIVLDDDAYKKFSELADSDRADILKNVEWMRAPTEGVDVMTLKLRSDGICTFLDADGLCSIQKKHGENFLTAICQSFPRVTYKLDNNIFEQSMTLTCPVAAQMILLSAEPITFSEVRSVTTRAVIGFKNRLFGNVEDFISVQKNAIKILQDRNFTLNQRLKTLYNLFGGKILSGVAFNLKEHSLTMVNIFNKMYNANLSESKRENLRDSYLFGRDKILHEVRERFSGILENYLVNEFFMRCYPYAFSGGELQNCRIFITSYRILEFAIVLTVIAKTRFSDEDMAALIISVNDMLDHSHGGMDAIINFVKSCDEKTFASTMLEG